MNSKEPSRIVPNPPKYEFDLVGQRTLEPDDILNAAQAANDYSVSLVNGNDLVGSSTLVTVEGVHGLLTADHVWQTLCQGEDAEDFCMVLGSQLHRFEYRFSQCTPIIVGRYSPDHEQEGPDLAFICLDNLLKVGDLKSRKSFYPLEPEKRKMFELIPYDQSPWLVWGAPAEKSSRSLAETGELVTRLGHFAGVSEFQERNERGGFDYVRVTVPSGEHNFPSNYGGVSGGGVWLPYHLSQDPAGKILKPMSSVLLAGVAYYQIEDGPGQKTLLLHGVRSIYERVFQQVVQQSTGRRNR
jgi:hypothetical protein